MGADGSFALHPKIGLEGTVDRFYLQFDPPSRYAFTARDVGGDDTIDSDADSVLGQTASFELDAAGDVLLDVDAGLLNAIGDCYEMLQQPEKARESFELSLELNPAQEGVKARLASLSDE